MFRLAIPPQPWAAQAACNGVDPDLFFPERGGSTREAKAVCRTCPVREACLQFALENREKFGIWGGMSERERRRLRSKKGQCLAPGERLPVEGACGTDKGYYRHKANGEDADQACKDAHAAAEAARQLKHRSGPPPYIFTTSGRTITMRAS